jgi:hypothetical protein
MRWCDLLWLLENNFAFLQTVVDTLPEAERARYSNWISNSETIRLNQQRAILDAILPDDFCLLALAGCRFRFDADEQYLYGGFSETAKDKLTAVEAYRRYGGAGLVDAIDRGRYRIEKYDQSGV